MIKDQRILNRASLPALTAESFVVYDISNDSGEPILDLTFDDNQNTKESSVRLFRAETGVPLSEQLKHCLRRRKDVSAYGFIFLSHKNNTGIGHVINYFVDSDNEVYFIDAQLGEVLDSNSLKRYHKDIFYLPSYPPEGFMVKKEVSPPIHVRLENEYIMKTEVDIFIEQVIKAIKERNKQKLSELQCKKSLTVTSSKGLFPTTHLLMNTVPKEAFEDCLWLLDNSDVPHDIAASSAAYSGHKELLEHLIHRFNPTNREITNIAYGAALGGHKEVTFTLIKKIQSPNTDKFNSIAFSAAQWGHKSLAEDIRMAGQNSQLRPMAPTKRPTPNNPDKSPGPTKRPMLSSPGLSSSSPAFFGPRNGNARPSSDEQHLDSPMENEKEVIAAQRDEIRGLKMQVDDLQKQLTSVQAQLELALSTEKQGRSNKPSAFSAL